MIEACEAFMYAFTVVSSNKKGDLKSFREEVLCRRIDEMNADEARCICMRILS
jgi:hypothetical protein